MKSAVAATQIEAEVPPPKVKIDDPPTDETKRTDDDDEWQRNIRQKEDVQTVPKLRRFHGSVRVDSARVGRDAGRIAEEVISHLAGQIGAEVKVTIEIEAFLPNGATDQLVRTVTENSRTLKFDSHGFERD